jgi:hypothetical protein
MKKYYLLIFSLMTLTGNLPAQPARIVFYNVENLFDLVDDTLTNDGEFLPDSARNWNSGRYWQKVTRIYQVLSAIGQWDMPAVVGLCEVENRKVLEDLVYRTPLSKSGYRIIHRDSPDPRGIDVALLYRPDIFQPDTAIWLRVSLPDEGNTREILLVRGSMWKGIAISIAVNHWPSRSGGALSSTPRRKAAAAALRAELDGLFRADPLANVICMGDFNDEPGDESMQMLTGMMPVDGMDCGSAMINLADTGRAANSVGTIRHRGAWSTFDQVLVSCPMMDGTGGLQVVSEGTEIFNAPFLLEPDPNYPGFRPFRTYLGPMYHNGFSDHLPVSIVVERVYAE